MIKFTETKTAIDNSQQSEVHFIPISHIDSFTVLEPDYEVVFWSQDKEYSLGTFPTMKSAIAFISILWNRVKWQRSSAVIDVDSLKGAPLNG